MYEIEFFAIFYNDVLIPKRLSFNMHIIKNEFVWYKSSWSFTYNISSLVLHICFFVVFSKFKTIITICTYIIFIIMITWVPQKKRFV